MSKLTLLSLTLKLHEKIELGPDIVLSFSQVRNKVRIHIQAPEEIKIVRVKNERPTQEE